VTESYRNPETQKFVEPCVCDDDLQEEVRKRITKKGEEVGMGVSWDEVGRRWGGGCEKVVRRL